jgi:hypothetical protein
LPKEGRKAGKRGEWSLGKEKPVGVSLRGVAGVIGLLTVARNGTDDQKQGEKQAEGEITEDTKEGFH